MKPTASLLLLATLWGSHARAAESSSAVPATFPPERYEALIARSPFTLATPPAAPPPPPDRSFADGWYVTSLARVDGRDFVSIKARDGGVQFSLFGEEVTKEGITLQKVDWSPSIGRSTVTIAREGQTAKLEFNQAELAAQPAAPPPQTIIRPGSPGTVARPTVPRPVPVVQPQGFGANPPGLPNVNQTVPRPGAKVTSGAGEIPNSGNPASNDGRRRIRVIQNNAAGQ